MVREHIFHIHHLINTVMIMWNDRCYGSSLSHHKRSSSSSTLFVGTRMMSFSSIALLLLNMTNKYITMIYNINNLITLTWEIKSYRHTQLFWRHTWDGQHICKGGNDISNIPTTNICRILHICSQTSYSKARHGRRGWADDGGLPSWLFQAMMHIFGGSSIHNQCTHTASLSAWSTSVALERTPPKQPQFMLGVARMVHGMLPFFFNISCIIHVPLPYAHLMCILNSQLMFSHEYPILYICLSQIVHCDECWEVLLDEYVLRIHCMPDLSRH